MVFESLVADILNKYVGDYVENLDKSQLNIAIWGGDVVLRNLDLKQSALDELDLPVKVVAGHVGTLILKIPWKKIYTEPVKVVIEDVFAVVVPNAGLKYDAEKEAKDQREKKEKQINKAESIKLAHDTKDEEKEKKKKGDSFGEKLGAQIVKNLQVKITNIHIRYEDFHTNPEQPFSIGITLDNLTFQTLDEPNDKRTAKEKEASSKISKAVSLNNLAVYWNDPTETYMKGAKEFIYNTMRNSIPRNDNRVKHQYVIRPINCKVDLQIDTKPERTNFSAPKVIMKLVLQEIGLQLSKTQYYDVMELLQSFERMVLADKYRKYRSLIPEKPSRRQMWKYAYTCILEEEVRRKRKMWSWIHIKNYREVMRIYKENWLKRLQSNKKSQEIMGVIESYYYTDPEIEETEKILLMCEKQLDVFAIMLVRSEAEKTFARQQKQKSKSGIFSFFKKKSEDKGITDQLNKFMTDDEYQKLYAAIGYEDNQPDKLPNEYVAHKLRFELGTLSLAILDTIDGQIHNVCKLEVREVHANIDQRPASNNLSVSARMGSFGVVGLSYGHTDSAVIIRSLTDGQSDLVDLQCELKPLDGSCDQCVSITARPIEIVYDASTVNQLVSFFKPPEHIQLKQLSKAAVSRYKSLKEQSVSGIKDIVSHHKYTELMVKIDASYILIPQKGIYLPAKSNTLVVDLGQLTIQSERDPDAPKMYRAKAALDKARKEGVVGQAETDESVNKMIEKAFDSFTIDLSNFQLLYCKAGSDWKSHRHEKMTPIHIIQPMGVNLLIQKSMLDDPRLPNIRLKGCLPQLLITLSDERIMELLQLFQSIPLPEVITEDTDSVSDQHDDNQIDDLRAMEAIVEEERDELSDELTADDSSKKSKVISTSTNMTEVDMSFEIEEIEIRVAQTRMGSLTPIVKLKLDSIGTEIQVRTFDIVVSCYLGGIYLQHLLYRVPDIMTEWIRNQSPRKYKQVMENGAVVNLINTPHDGQNEKLLNVVFVMAHSDNPEFSTTYKNTEQKLQIEFSSLEVLLHEEALLSLVSFAQDLQAKIETALETQPAEISNKPSSVSSRRSSNVSDIAGLLRKTAEKKVLKALEKKRASNTIKLDVMSKMDVVDCCICTKQKLITNLQIKGFETKVQMMESHTYVEAKLCDIVMIDPDPATSYSQVMSIVGSEVFKLELTVYNNLKTGSNLDIDEVNTRIKLNVNSIRFVFLYKFINHLIKFVNNFESAKQRALEMGKVAGERAKDAAVDLANKATRIALDITVKAPVMVMPADSKSKSALLFDFGVLTVNNKFTLDQTSPDKNQQSAIFDHMIVELNQLQIRRALLSETDVHKSLSTCCILEPVSLETVIIRKLSAGTFIHKPDVEIKAKLKPLRLSCSQEDLTSLMLIIHENLDEGFDADPEILIEEAAKKQKEKSTEVIDMELDKIEDNSADKTELYDQIKLKFILDSIQAVLYTGDSDLQSAAQYSQQNDRSTIVVPRDTSRSLARLSMQKLSADFLLKSDKNIKSVVTLYRCDLDDVRPNQHGITRRGSRSIRMIERVGIDGGAQDSKEMIKLIFEQNPVEHTKKVQIYLHKLFIIVCVPYLVAVSDFFIKGLPELEPKQKVAVQRQQDAAPTEATKELITEDDTSIELFIDNPEVILVEDSNDVNTNALILNTGVKFQMRLGQDLMKIFSTLNLQIISARYNIQDMKYKRMSQIMPECEISLIVSDQDKQGKRVDVRMGNLDICMSPAVISTISKVVSNLQFNQSSEQKSETVSNTSLWLKQDVKNLDFWYLKTQPPDEYQQITERLQSDGARGDQMLINCSTITLKLEGGIGNRTVPLLVAELSMNAEVKDWSSQLYATFDIGVEVSYFNEKSSVWEPFLEPVELGHKSNPWNLQLEIKKNEDYYDDDETDDESETDVILLQPPKTTLTVLSEDTLQICLSKAGLEMLTSLGKAFGDAYNQVQPSIRAGESVAPYSIRNDTDLLIDVKLDKQLEIINTGTQDDKSQQGAVTGQSNTVTLEAGQLISLQLKRNSRKQLESLLKRSQEGQQLEFRLQIPELNLDRDVTIQKAITRLFNAYQANKSYAVVVQTNADLGRRQVIIRSNTQFRNNLDVTVIVQVHRGKTTTELTRIEPGVIYTLPYSLLYSETDHITLKPDIENVMQSDKVIKLRDVSKSLPLLINCPYTDQNRTNYNILLQPSVEKVQTENSSDLSSQCILYTLSTPITLQNQLPYAISIEVKNQKSCVTVLPGEILSLHTCVKHAQFVTLTVMSYLEHDWVCSETLNPEHVDEMRCWTFKSPSAGSSKILRLHVMTKLECGMYKLSIYSPYWLMNRTGMQLAYCDSSNIEETTHSPHEGKYEQPYLFSYNEFNDGKNKSGILTRKSKAVMRIGDSKWSDKFSLDTAGSSGTVFCKSNEGFNYEMGVKITLVSTGLTKIVEISPFIIVINKTSSTVKFTEQITGGDPVSLKPDQISGIWSRSNKKNREMKISVEDKSGYPLTSKPFSFSTVNCTLLKMSSDNASQSAYNVDVSISELGVIITVEDYRLGMESARLVNCTPDTLVTYKQKGCETISKVAPGETALFTWDEPLSNRTLLWSSGLTSDQKDDLQKDGFGEFFVDKDGTHKLFWTSFLDGEQRVILFTDDYYQVSRAREAGEFERMDLEVVLNLEGVGLSLVDNYKQAELSYISITSSGVVWEEKRRKRWRGFNTQICIALEESWFRYERDKLVGKNPNPVVNVEKLRVDLSEMRQIQPEKRLIRRTFQPGVWISYKTSVHLTQLHAKVNRIQIDNQLRDAVYPVVFSPTPLPKSIAAESIPKPLIEASLVMRKHEFTDVQQIKYLKVLIQEMTVKADQGYLNGIVMFFMPNKTRTPGQMSKDFESDIQSLSLSLHDTTAGQVKRGKKNFYDLLHFSPLKIHVSFTVQGGGGGQSAPIQSEVVQLFLQSLGVVVTDIQDIIFRIACFEREFVFYEDSALVHQIRRHYTQQGISQMYALILGLDVLGNPLGLVQGFAEGAKDLFYEPIQGAIQGPGEFVEGLGLGLRSLLSGTLGGAAGAVSRITGTLGKGLAALTLDDNYQKKRREKMNKEPANVGEGLMRGVKGLGMGFFDGVTGIVRKPVEGAKEEGVGGFFKGVGKGLIGVVARPTGGIVDFASSSFEGIRKVTTLSEQVTRIRPPRVLNDDGVITPYSLRQAAGNNILVETEGGKFSKTDRFVAHCLVTPNGRDVLLATDKRVMYVKRGELLGHWDHEWHYDWAQLMEPPSLQENNKIKLFAKEAEKPKFSLFKGKQPHGKLVPIYDVKEAEWMVKQLIETFTDSVNKRTAVIH